MVVCPEGQAFLRSLKSKDFCVAGVIGKYRSGKSLLMNRIAGYQSGFDLGHLIAGKTRGIWVWPEPIITDDNKRILLLDTEGLADTKKHQAYDQNMFAMTAMLSSLLIVNCLNVIDSSTITELR